MFIDAVCIYGENKNFSVSLNTVMAEDDTTSSYIVHNGVKFVPFDLSDYAIKFSVLGSATADAKVLLEHIITQDTDQETVGQITDPVNGQFIFAISKEETIQLGLGKHPIKLDILDIDTLEHIFTLTEGGDNAEFNKIFITQV